MSSNAWIGVDLDGTLAHYDEWRGIHHIGDPIPAMVERVKNWVALGITVKIFTARLAESNDRRRTDVVRYINEWQERVFGFVLEVTNIKDYGMLELWDDRAVQVEQNTGKILGYSTRGL